DDQGVITVLPLPGPDGPGRGVQRGRRRAQHQFGAQLVAEYLFRAEGRQLGAVQELLRQRRPVVGQVGFGPDECDGPAEATLAGRLNSPQPRQGGSYDQESPLGHDSSLSASVGQPSIAARSASRSSSDAPSRSRLSSPASSTSKYSEARDSQLPRPVHLSRSTMILMIPPSAMCRLSTAGRDGVALGELVDDELGGLGAGGGAAVGVLLDPVADVPQVR